MASATGIFRGVRKPRRVRIIGEEGEDGKREKNTIATGQGGPPLGGGERYEIDLSSWALFGL